MSEARLWSRNRSERGSLEAAVPRSDHNDQRSGTDTQEWQECSRQQDRTGQIYRDLLCDAFVTDSPVQEIQLFHNAGIVDQHIDPAVSAPNRLFKRKHVHACGNVAAENLNRRVLRLEFVKCRFIARAGDHLGAFRCEPHCERSTDARRAAGYHDDAAAPQSPFRMDSSHRPGTSSY